MKGKIYSFKNENGEVVKFTVKEYLELNKNEYILMTPENDSSHIDVYKFNFSNGNESLELVEDKKELSNIKSISKII